MTSPDFDLCGCSMSTKMNDSLTGLCSLDMHCLYCIPSLDNKQVACGPQEFFLQPARAFSIAENFVKA